MKKNSFFESADCTDSHRFSERNVVSVICEDLRKSVDNPSGRDGPWLSHIASPIAFSPLTLRFRDSAAAHWRPAIQEDDARHGPRHPPRD